MELAEPKLHPPPARPGIMPRAGLMERLLASAAVPVVCVVAPAGYGKTTLLAQWAQPIDPRIVHGLTAPDASILGVVPQLALRWRP